MEGLGELNLGGEGGLAPLLPEKRRWGEVGEVGSRSPSLSGFSSPHSGSSVSIPFSSSMSSDPLRGLGGASSPGAGMIFTQWLSSSHKLFIFSAVVSYFNPSPDLNITLNPNLCPVESVNKQDTVKFVQDTSKFWYKPDISRDQGKCWFWTRTF